MRADGANAIDSYGDLDTLTDIENVIGIATPGFPHNPVKPYSPMPSLNVRKGLILLINYLDRIIGAVAGLICVLFELISI